MTIKTTRFDLDPRCGVSNVTLELTDSVAETTLELDSLADTCVIGWHALIILDFNQPVSIVGYDASLGTHTFKTVSGAFAYTDHMTGRMLHLVINQEIHIPHLDHHLLCPMQCHVNDVTVDEMLKFLAHQPH